MSIRVDKRDVGYKLRFRFAGVIWWGGTAAWLGVALGFAALVVAVYAAVRGG